MRYAAYGSNLHPLRLQQRLASMKLLGTQRLGTRSLAFHKRGRDGSGKCSISVGSDSLFVAVYEIDPDGLARLDRIEGVGTGYDRIVVDVPGYGACHSYRASPSYVDESLKPFDWYRELVLLGCRYHGFPPDYTDRIRRADTMEDPDRNRRSEQWRLAAMLEAAL
ncbi:MAG: gamma-glutamylcyclotransferase family protein [Woeseiaceae bacterium]|nr:gamma-glutamylcyclotransferase family protein [Woeseiaceae bacterium]